MADGGIIKFEMYPDTAPKTVAQISGLIQKGFYDGLVFHRVVPGFVIQGGDPKGNGTGGSGTNIPAEFNDRKHLLGTVAMARSQNPDSADSQFYICLDRIPYLDKNYTVFGQVTEGIEVVQKVKMGDTMKKVTVVMPA
jgi:cyclophilin family peptidyl-prolyl cis-trans isomerase